ncbi:MAG TPA: arginine deiminase-related protein [Steroidobacteraceae bacterium]
MGLGNSAGTLIDEPRTALPQCTGAVLMVRPAACGYNPETAATNKLQMPEPDPAAAQARALAEFDAFVTALRGEGIAVCVAEDTPTPVKPDALFPNNWVSFHEDGTVVLYPMHAENRRAERRSEVLDAVAKSGFRISRVLDLTHHEGAGRFLEGTGSLLLDHASRVAYACISPRTHALVAEEWGRELGYEMVLFEALDRNGVPFYHTNVMMSIGSRTAVLASCAISRPHRERLTAKLTASAHEVIEIDHAEIGQFAGNMLELASWDEALGDCHLLVMSESARRGLKPQTYTRLCAAVDGVLAVPVPTIERLGGGSVRCMLAEIFLPTAATEP